MSDATREPGNDPRAGAEPHLFIRGIDNDSQWFFVAQEESLDFANPTWLAGTSRSRP